MVLASTQLTTVDNALQGYNSTLFAYGQTGSGKSYTMLGLESGKVDAGVIPRVCSALLSKIEPQTATAQTTVAVSMLEIHNERIRDLLDSTSGASLQLRQHKTLGFYVPPDPLPSIPAACCVCV